MLNQRVLARDGFATDALGLTLTPARAGGFIAGAILMASIFAAMSGGLWLLVPFHYQRVSNRLGDSRLGDRTNPSELSARFSTDLNRVVRNSRAEANVTDFAK